MVHCVLNGKGKQMNTQIITNGQYRQILFWHELTAKEQACFDYLDTDEKQQEASFVRYKGNVYDLSEFVCAPDALQLIGWHGIDADSYFSGTLVYYSRDNENVLMARYFT